MINIIVVLRVFPPNGSPGLSLSITTHLQTTISDDYCQMCFEADASDSLISRSPP